MASATWTERLAMLVGRLPEAGGASFLPGVRRLKSALLESRPLRVLLTGPAVAAGETLVLELGGGPVAEAAPPAPPAGWRSLAATRGTMQVLIVKDSAGFERRGLQTLLRATPADLAIFLLNGAAGEARPPTAAEVVGLERTLGLQVVLVQLARREASRELPASAGLEVDFLVDPAVAADRAALGARLFELAPAETHLGLARFLGERGLQDLVARRLTRLAAGLSAAITATPLPVADLVPLTALQLSLITAIAYASGRELSLAAARDLSVALGANVGAALGFREAARALLKVALPGTGAAISAGIAFAGTWGIGEAARSFFVNGEPLAGGRRFVRRLQRPRLSARGR